MIKLVVFNHKYKNRKIYFELWIIEIEFYLLPKANAKAINLLSNVVNNFNDKLNKFLGFDNR
jgi:hypothetical protein